MYAHNEAAPLVRGMQRHVAGAEGDGSAVFRCRMVLGVRRALRQLSAQQLVRAINKLASAQVTTRRCAESGAATASKTAFNDAYAGAANLYSCTHNYTMTPP
jgi:hypothetical protein